MFFFLIKDVVDVRDRAVVADQTERSRLNDAVAQGLDPFVVLKALEVLLDPICGHPRKSDVSRRRPVGRREARGLGETTPFHEAKDGAVSAKIERRRSGRGGIELEEDDVPFSSGYASDPELDGAAHVRVELVADLHALVGVEVAVRANKDARGVNLVVDPLAALWHGSHDALADGIDLGSEVLRVRISKELTNTTYASHGCFQRKKSTDPPVFFSSFSFLNKFI